MNVNENGLSILILKLGRAGGHTFIFNYIIVVFKSENLNFTKILYPRIQLL